MSKEFSQFSTEQKEKTLDDFFKIRGGTLSLIGTLQTENFIEGKRGVQIKNEGLSAGSLDIAGATSDSQSTTIPGALTHVGNSVGFYNVSPVARQTVANLVDTFGTSDGTISDVGASFNQTTLNNNFRDVSDKLNALITALRNTGIIS